MNARLTLNRVALACVVAFSGSALANPPAAAPTASADSSAFAASVAAATAAAVAKQFQSQGQLQGQSLDAKQIQSLTNNSPQSLSNNSPSSSNAALTVNTPADTRVTVRNVPALGAVYAPASANCRIGIGVQGAGVGFGFGIGSSVLDEGCDAREDVRLLVNMGKEAAAIKRACAKPELAAALGNECGEKQKTASIPVQTPPEVVSANSWGNQPSY